MITMLLVVGAELGMQLVFDLKLKGVQLSPSCEGHQVALRDVQEQGMICCDFTRVSPRHSDVVNL